MAPPIGRNVEVNPSASPLWRWKKLIAAVRGTTPTRVGFPTARAMMYPT